jgi:hypothetical protein
MPANRQNVNGGSFFNLPQSFGASQRTTAAQRDATTAPAAQATASTNPNTAPPNVAAAPTGSNPAQQFTGLCEALNAWQQGLVKSKTYSIADQYEIVFAPETMGNATVKKPGATNDDRTPMQQPTTAKTAVDPATNSTNTAGRLVSVAAGTQIVQFIDQTLRASSYISDQQTWVVDEVTQKTVKNTTAGKNVAWYKITVIATSLGADKQRNDQAYKITYLITPYAINETQSQYFPQTSFRGVHKSYPYWFTGENIAVLSYEQNINSAYLLAVSGSLPQQQQAYDVNSTVLYKRSFQTRSDQSDQGADGKTLEPAANLADYLYNPADFAMVTLKIIGDPAWLQQGECSSTLNASNFSFSPFNADGGINFDASEVCFNIIWNQPEDYNFNTGLMEVNNNQKSSNGTYVRNHPQQNQTYRANRLTSTFSKGSFTQTLKGSLLTTVPGQGPSSAASATATAGRPAPTPSVTGGNNNTGSRQPTILSSSAITDAGAGIQRFDDGSSLQTFDDGSTLAIGTDGSVSSTTIGPEAAGNPDPQPAAPPDDPTSNGDVNVADSLGPGEEIVADSPQPAQIIAQDD